MKCAKCGAELKLGCIYCSVCGHEAQIVSDSSLLEEEYLRDILKEKKPAKKQPEGEKKPQKKKRTNMAWILSLSFAFVLMISGAAVLFMERNKNNNSYDYQMKKAEASIEEQEEAKALEFFRRALELNPDDTVVRHRMAELYFTMEEEEAAIELLHEIIALDRLDEEAYALLIDYYHEKGDFEAILKMKEEAEGGKIEELFSSYETKAPVFNLEPGTYSDYITVGLTAENEAEIYYTTDGSDPILAGEKYEKPFEIEEQRTLKICAVACNPYGIYSDAVEGIFTVKFQKPPMPRAIPDGGTFREAVTVELSGSEGSRIYYTWDGSDPTLESDQYTEPLAIPEGDNILSVLLVDKYGMMSNILKCNYKYLPFEQQN